jgi:hypothetical protein
MPDARIVDVVVDKRTKDKRHLNGTTHARAAEAAARQRRQKSLMMADMYAMTNVQ